MPSRQFETTTDPRSPGSPWPRPEAAKFLRVSIRHLIRLGDANKIKQIRFGRRVFIPDVEVQRLASQGSK